MSEGKEVPVTFNGVVVGSARVHDDGSIIMTMDASEPTKGLLDHISFGLVTDLSIRPTVRPAIDTKLALDQLYFDRRIPKFNDKWIDD